jgi:uncharacterized protein (TIGR02647 family)
MPYSPEMIEELNMLSRFNLMTTQEGLKVHHDAEAAVVSATGRLFEKGLITRSDGGYLTDLGREAAEHAQSALMILQSPPCN